VSTLDSLGQTRALPPFNGNLTDPKDGMDQAMIAWAQLKQTTVVTLHLNGKFLSTKTTWDFEGVFDTIEPNWFCPQFFFVHRTSSGGAIYNSSKSKVQKVMKMKNEHHFHFKNF
jgi:hypothetical protein